MDKEINKVNSYQLSRNWFDWCFENPDKISPTHIAMYFFIIEHCNRLGWKEKFGLPMEMTKDAIGIKNYRTFTKVFNDLISWGFIILIQKSKNQYSSNIVAIAKNTIATTKALDKAIQKQSQKQVHDIVGIDKQYNNITNNLKKEDSNYSFDFCKPEFFPMLEKWIQYMATAKKKVLTQMQVEACYSLMISYSNNNLIKAWDIVNKSILGGYLNLYEPEYKNQSKSTKQLLAR